MIYYKDKHGILFNGDSLKIISEFPEAKIDMCITSPPYWALRNYHSEGQLGQEPFFKEYVLKLCTYFDEVHRVLKDNGSLYVNLGDTFYGSTKGAGGKTEKQLTNPGSYYNKGNKEARIENFSTFTNKELPNKSLCLIPSRFAIEMQERGWTLRGDIIWHKPNKFPESVKDRFTLDYEHVFFFTKISKGYYFNQQFEPTMQESSKKKLQSSWDGMGEKEVAWDTMRTYMGGEKAKELADKGVRNKRSVWSINTHGVRGMNHFAKYPEELIESPIKASCPEGGVVLDIFMGSGTTAIVAEKQNKKWIGIELNEEYCKIAVERILSEREFGT